MEIWLDTCHHSTIIDAKERGILHGITTNPLILAESKKPPLKVLEELLEIQSGPVTAQVTALSTKEMVNQGKKLAKLSKRIIVKVPVSNEGLKAIAILSKEGVPIMATTIYDPLQAIAAFKAGADYGALYIGRMDDAHLNPFDAIAIIMDFIKNYESSAKLIPASIRSRAEIMHCLKLGCAAITLKEKPYALFIEEHPLTLKNIQEFSSSLPLDWI